MKKVLLLILCLSTIIFSYAQQKSTVSGTIKSKTKGETLIGVTIRAGNAATTSNEYGFYSLTLENGTYIFEFSAIGFQIKTETVALDKDVTLISRWKMK